MNVRDYSDIRLPPEPKTYPCRRCNGAGTLAHDECGGSGVILDDDGELHECGCNNGRRQCPTCDGSGIVPE